MTVPESRGRLAKVQCLCVYAMRHTVAASAFVTTTAAGSPQGKPTRAQLLLKLTEAGQPVLARHGDTRRGTLDVIAVVGRHGSCACRLDLPSPA